MAIFVLVLFAFLSAIAGAWPVTIIVLITISVLLTVVANKLDQ